MLGGILPGRTAQYRMAPEGREGDGESSSAKATVDDWSGGDGERGSRSAAVLVVLFPDGDALRTIFMKRNIYDGPHSGQISFPGGMYEEADQDLKQTALRETGEETGLNIKKLEVLGRLSPLFIPVSNFYVSPFVAWYGEKPEFCPDASEVQYLLTPSLDELMDPSNHHKGNIRNYGYDIVTSYIQLDKDIIWGATAMILSEFMELIER